MSNLIVLGDSFSRGVGCYDIDLYNSYNVPNHNELPPIYHEKTKEFTLNNSIGKYLQKEFGFSHYYNYAYPGSSNISQFLKFFNNLPSGDNNTILWQITLYDRKPMIYNNRFFDSYLNQNKWVNEYYIELLDHLSKSDEKIDEQERSELSLYINVLKEFCKSKDWYFYVWFWIGGEYDKMLHQFPNLKECIIPYNNLSMDNLESYGDITGDMHPNQFGYKQVATNLIKVIHQKCPNFPQPNETPISLSVIGNDIRNELYE